MKFQSLVTVTVMTTLLVTPSSAAIDSFSCIFWFTDVGVGVCSGCGTFSECLTKFPRNLRSLSVEAEDPGDYTLLDNDAAPAVFPRLKTLTITGLLVTGTEPCALCPLPALKSVALENATVERLSPDLLANSSKLQEFRAVGCGLSGVPEELFAGNPDLRTVNLSGNALTNLPIGIFSSNGNLRKVSLARNRLTELPLGLFDGNPRLEEVWLEGNALTSLPEGLFVGENFFGNGTLSLEGNPLSCDCRLQSVVTQLDRQLGWTVRLPEGCREEMVHASCSTPSYSSSSCPVLVTVSLYLRAVGWTIWQVAKGLLDTQ